MLCWTTLTVSEFKVSTEHDATQRYELMKDMPKVSRSRPIVYLDHSLALQLTCASGRFTLAGS